MSVVESRGTVTVATERCKGCELCIPACPPRVLRMSSQLNADGPNGAGLNADGPNGAGLNGLGVPYPELLPGCTGCGACLLVCPDFCFEVYQYAKPVQHEVAS